MSEQRHFAHGKILLSGEYAVLSGAKALALPTMLGQELRVADEGEFIHWQSMDYLGKCWFTARFDLECEILETSTYQNARFIQKMLRAAYRLSGIPARPIKFCSFLEFPSNWGLGSSSSLTYLLASYFELDPFQLFFATQNGSGYDIACAGAQTPLFYQLEGSNPSWELTSLTAVYQNAEFIYLGQKQDSRKEVDRYHQLKITAEQIKTISAISESLTQVSQVQELQFLMRKHESILESILKRPAVKAQLFQDYPGEIKSLGAWGGDFIMAVGENTREYFQSRGYDTILHYSELFCLTGDK